MLIKGIASSNALGIAEAYVIPPRDISAGQEIILPEQVEEQREHFFSAVEELDREYARNLDRLSDRNGIQKDILEVHRAMLHDVTLEEEVTGRIGRLIPPACAVEQTIGELISQLSQSSSDYLRERAQDLKDVGTRLISVLQGIRLPDFTAFTKPVVLVADDLSPSDTAMLNPEIVRGIVIAKGSATSHTAILAKAMGIPAVLGCGEAIRHIHPGELLYVNGPKGLVEYNLRPSRIQELVLTVRRWSVRMRMLEDYRDKPTRTRDGTAIGLYANILGTSSLERVTEAHADGVGLFRTEFLYLDRLLPPDEAEQCAIYRQAAATLGDRNLTIRTMDLGGDKDLPCLGVEKEENPLLGCRGIRFCFRHPDLFITQLRAILRADTGTSCILYPMIGGLDELLAARDYLYQAMASLAAEDIPFRRDIRQGIMVEVPAAALMSRELIRHCDFISIGTNDLTQYVTAADRLNAEVCHPDAHFDPAVLRLIAMTAESCREAGKPCSICGEMACDPLAVPLLLGLGVRHLSMNPTSLLAARQLISTIDLREARTLAKAALACSTRQEVTEQIHVFYPQL